MREPMTGCVWITGANGQVGRALLQQAPASVHAIALGRHNADLHDTRWISALEQESPPALILHVGAWTAVDKAETEREAAWNVNVEATRALGECAARHHAHLIYVSTDYVFPGDRPVPWSPDDSTGPLSWYGETKLQGERALQSITGLQCAIVRTSWVYDAQGQNFLRTMLRLMSERDNIGVVADQFGTPTSSNDLACFLWQVAQARATGVFHFSNAGSASWYDFAVAIYEEATALGLLHRSVSIRPIATADYPTPARRPAFSILNRATAWELAGAPSPHWRVSLRTVLQGLRHSDRA
jgi:dTDP-4-dehydrorhamnose reductase